MCGFMLPGRYLAYRKDFAANQMQRYIYLRQKLSFFQKNCFFGAMVYSTGGISICEP